ncbi:terpenoid synthase [Pilatotrama ljubarskyi]|nr:terpenoid synthase [Pilatotrama ljubarskyi]
MDLMNVFFAINEFTDAASPSAVQNMVDIVADAMHHPYKTRPAGEIVLGEMTREFAERVLQTVTPEAYCHLVESLTDYLNSVLLLAEDRYSGGTCTLEDFGRIRRENIGGRLPFSVSEMHLSIPDDAFYHPHIVELRTCIIDMMIIIADIMSYSRQQATDNDDHKLLTVVMRELNMDLHGAMGWVMGYYDDLSSRFIQGLADVPTFGLEIDGQLQEYLHNIGNWPRALECWSFESKRYFGERGLEYQKTRQVLLEHHREDMRMHRTEGLAQVITV